MNIKILKATLTHVEDFTFVFCESWKVAYKNILSEEEIEKNTNKEKRKQMFTSLFISENGYFFIAYDESFPCGIVYARIDIKNNIEIVALYTIPDYWGKGVGKKLMDIVLETAKKYNLRKMELWTLDKNFRARKFYEKYGFKCLNEYKDSGFVNLKEVSYNMEI